MFIVAVPSVDELNNKMFLFTELYPVIYYLWVLTGLKLLHRNEIIFVMHIDIIIFFENMFICFHFIMGITFIYF